MRFRHAAAALLFFAPLAIIARAQSGRTASYLPNAQASKVVTVTERGQPAARIIVQTHAVAVKETGPKETVKTFGEVYAFSPATIFVHRDEPTLIEFWNLQPDDEHDFMLMDPRWAVLMKAVLPALKKTSWIFTFHEEGLFNFTCVAHQPEMNGQILVLPPAKR
jgi:plastocyanin